MADTTNDIIRKLALVGTNWVVSTIAGLAGSSGSTDGTNQNSRFDDPGGITVDSAGNLYVADSGNNTIRKIIPAGTNWAVSTIAGLTGFAGVVDGTGTNALFTILKASVLTYRETCMWMVTVSARDLLSRVELPCWARILCRVINIGSMRNLAHHRQLLRAQLGAWMVIRLHPYHPRPAITDSLQPARRRCSSQA